MVKALLSLAILLVLCSWPTVASAQSNPVVLDPPKPQLQEIDPRPLVLKHYLQNYNSPLADHAEYMIKVSDDLGLDWRLIPSVAAVESQFGMRIPGGTDPKYTSYNAWGWGVYGSKRLHFKSWEEGISTVAKGLKTKYVDDGLTTLNQINNRYSSNPDWWWMVEQYWYELTDYETAFMSKFGQQIADYNQNIRNHNAPKQVFQVTDLSINNSGTRLSLDGLNY